MRAKPDGGEGRMTRKEQGEAEGCGCGAEGPCQQHVPGPRCRGAAAQPPAPWVQTGGNEAALGFSGGVLHLVFPSKNFSAAVHPSLDVEFT